MPVHLSHLEYTTRFGDGQTESAAFQPTFNLDAICVFEKAG
jgi:hypothetical protein